MIVHKLHHVNIRSKYSIQHFHHHAHISLHMGFFHHTRSFVGFLKHQRRLSVMKTNNLPEKQHTKTTCKYERNQIYFGCLASQTKFIKSTTTAKETLNFIIFFISMEKYNLIQMFDSVHCHCLKAQWMTSVKCRQKNKKHAHKQSTSM